MLLASGSLRASSSPDQPAAVVVIGGLSGDHAIQAAAAEVPARWRLETLVPQTAPPPAPQGDIDKMARAYLEADFLACVSEIERASLHVDLLLEQGHRSEAARTGIFAAACALGAGDEGRAREQLRRLLARELLEPAVLRRTTPDFQRIAEEERLAAQRRGRVAVEVRSDPAGARVRIDGIVSCPTTPCRLHVYRGEHAVVAEKLGQRPRVMTTLLDQDQTLTLELDPASADEIHRQLADTLNAGADPSAAEIPRAASAALGVGLLVLAWRQKGQVHAIVYYRSGGTLTHVALADGPHAASRAVTAVLREWRMDTKPRSMFREPLFWATAAGVAVLSAGAALLMGQHQGGTRR